MTKLQRYERASSYPLVGLSLVFLALYAAPILSPGMPTPVRQAIAVCEAVLWAVFAIDFLIRAGLSGRPARYVVTHPLDVLLVAVPALRPLRLLRVFSALQVLLRQGRMTSVAGTAAGAAGAGVLLLFMAALAMLDAERGQDGANIASFPDALWWAAATFSTVGYGDAYPVTGLGRLVAFASMLVGVSILGVVTASVAAWFVGQAEAAEEESDAGVRDELAALRAEVAALRGVLETDRLA